MAKSNWFHLTVKSGNSKTGVMPVTTTSKDSCSPTCPLYYRGCYVHQSPLEIHWNKVSDRTRGTDLTGLCEQIAALPEGTVWRHNQAGDLPGIGDRLDTAALAKLVKANIGLRGFTYTHKPLTRKAERQSVADANAQGFTVNLSADSPAEADTLADLAIGPVVVALPKDKPLPGYTPAGRKIVQCPQQTHGLTCAECQLCLLPRRKSVIAFEAHGNEAKYVGLNETENALWLVRICEFAGDFRRSKNGRKIPRKMQLQARQLAPRRNLC